MNSDIFRKAIFQRLFLFVPACDGFLYGELVFEKGAADDDAGHAAVLQGLDVGQAADAARCLHGDGRKGGGEFAVEGGVAAGEGAVARDVGAEDVGEADALLGGDGVFQRQRGGVLPTVYRHTLNAAFDADIQRQHQPRRAEAGKPVFDGFRLLNRH